MICDVILTLVISAVITAIICYGIVLLVDLWEEITGE